MRGGGRYWPVSTRSCTKCRSGGTLGAIPRRILLCSYPKEASKEESPQGSDEGEGGGKECGWSWARPAEAGGEGVASLPCRWVQHVPGRGSQPWSRNRITWEVLGQQGQCHASLVTQTLQRWEIREGWALGRMYKFGDWACGWRGVRLWSGQQGSWQRAFHGPEHRSGRAFVGGRMSASDVR